MLAERRQARQLGAPAADEQLERGVERVGAGDARARPAPAAAARAVERPAGAADRQPDAAVLAERREARDRPLGARGVPARARDPQQSLVQGAQARIQTPAVAFSPRRRSRRGNPRPPRARRRPGRDTGARARPRSRARASRRRRAPCTGAFSAASLTRSASTCPPWKPMLTRRACPRAAAAALLDRSGISGRRRAGRSR